MKRPIIVSMIAGACMAPQSGWAQESPFGEAPEAKEFAQCVVDRLDAKGLAGSGEMDLGKRVYDSAYAACKPERAVRKIVKRLHQMEPRLSADDAQTIARGQIESLIALGLYKLLGPPHPPCSCAGHALPPPIIIPSAPSPTVDGNEPSKEANAPNQ